MIFKYKNIASKYYIKILIFVMLVLNFSKNSTYGDDIKYIYEKNMKKLIENDAHNLNTKTTKSFIKKITSFNEIDFENYFTKETDLVLFDIDHTILKPEKLHIEYIFSNDEKCNEKMTEIKNAHADKIDLNAFLGFLSQSSKMHVIEPFIIEKIKLLKKKSINLVAITAMPTGCNFGLKDSWQNWRFNQLKEVGFEGSFSDLAFSFYSSKFYERPIFYKGIIFSDSLRKGKVLELFLENFNKLDELVNLKNAKYIFLDGTEKNLEKYKNFHLKPKRIIMFDDSDEYLKSVLETCNKLQIEFHGYHYKPYEISEWSSECEHQINESLDIFLKMNDK